MRLPNDPIGEVPPGYAVHRIGDTWLVLDQKTADQIVPLRLAEPEVREGLFTGAPTRGRGAAPSVAVTQDFSIVLRRYRHGGLFGRITGPLFWGPSRALQELRVTSRAEREGAAVPHVVCLVLWPAFGPFWSAILGTREERQARDLLVSIQDAPSPLARRELSRRAGAAIGRMHDAGVEHRDLQLRNVLLTESDGTSRVVIVDLDRAVFHPRGWLPTRRRAQNLGRLARSAFKSGIWGNPLDRRDLAAFVAAYTAKRRDLRTHLRRHICRERAKLALHRATYPFRG